MPADHGPVFIGGLDRSGKTPLRRILESSPEIAFSRRTYLWTHFLGRYGDLGEDARRARCFAELRRYRRFDELGVDLAVVERELEAGPPTYARLFGLIGAQAALAAGKPRWGEQEGGVEDHLGDILAAFPDARVVHMLRDPRDRHLAVAAGGRRPGLLGISVSRWRANARRALANAASHPAAYLVVRYEDLAAAPRETVERIGRFIGEPAPERLAAAAIDWAATPGAGYEMAALGGWQAAMSRTELAFVDAHLAAELAATGYPLARRPMSPRQRLAYVGMTWPFNSASPIVARAVAVVARLRGGAAQADKVRLDEAPA